VPTRRGPDVLRHLLRVRKLLFMCGCPAYTLLLLLNFYSLFVTGYFLSSRCKVKTCEIFSYM